MLHGLPGAGGHYGVIPLGFSRGLGKGETKQEEEEMSPLADRADR